MISRGMGWCRGSLWPPKNTHLGCPKTPIIKIILRETYILGWEKHQTACLMGLCECRNYEGVGLHDQQGY